MRRGNEFTFVQVGDVDWIEGLGDYAGLHVGGRTHLVREPLTLLEARLDPTQFVRIHRSTIVQVERIARVEPSANRDAVLTLRDGKTLRVSRTYRSRLEEPAALAFVMFQQHLRSRSIGHPGGKSVVAC